MEDVNRTVRHDHQHSLNRFAVIPTPTRLKAVNGYSGKGVTIAFLDSGFYPHPDLIEPGNRIVAFKDVAAPYQVLSSTSLVEDWQWHGTQTAVVAAGNGTLARGAYRGLASESHLVLVKVSDHGHISEENIARGIEWVIENRDRYDIRILNISLGGDEDVACSQSMIDQAAEAAIRHGIVVVVAAGNSGADGKHSIPPANSPSVITVGGYSDENSFEGDKLELYHSNFGITADGTVKPEIIAPAMWVAAPIVPGTALYVKAEALSLLAETPDYELQNKVGELYREAELPRSLAVAGVDTIRDVIEQLMRQNKIVATHYQHVDGTSFAAPIVSSIVAQMLEANPRLTPGAIKNILISTADRIASRPVIRQGYGTVNARRAIELALTEEHELNTVGCAPPRVENDRLIFLFHDDTAKTVAVVGDFNRWEASRGGLTKDAGGLWRIEIQAPLPGRYEYKFLVDGNRWIEDPSNGQKVPDGFGGLNSVLIIE